MRLADLHTGPFVTDNMPGTVPSDQNGLSNAITCPTSLKKRKRDLETIWSGSHNAFERASFASSDGESMVARSYPSSMLDLSSRPRLQPTLSKKRRLEQQAQVISSLQPHPSAASSPSLQPPTLSTSSQRPRPSPLMIPHPSAPLDSWFSSTQTSPEVSPKTVLPSWNEVLNATMNRPSTTMTEPEQETSPIVPALVLRPCHVCYRRPTTRVMLDAYADCELCGQRACYICLRECDSLDCLQRNTNVHSMDSASKLDRPRRICSKCAIEGLTETGDEIVWCLDCVKALEGVQAT